MASQNDRASKNEIELSGVIRSLGSLFIPATGLMLGQYDPAKTATIDYVPIKVISADDVGLKAGFGSHAHRQALRLPPAVFSQGNGIWWAPVPDGGGATAATEDITFVGAATSSGTLYYLIAGDLVQVGISNGDAITDIGDKLVDAITSDQNLNVTAVNTVGVVALTSKTKGLSGNQTLVVINPAGDSQTNSNPTGITQTLSNIDGYLSAGATDPVVESVFFDGGGNDILGDRWYTDCTMPYTDATNIGWHKASSESRADPAVNRFYGHIGAYTSETTYAQALALPEATNGKYIGEIWDDRSQAPAYELSAALFGIVLDEKNEAPNRPYHTLDTGIPADDSIVNRRYLENDALFKAGMSYCAIDTAGVLRLGDIALTYRKNDAGGKTEEWFDYVTLGNRQAKSYSLQELFRSEAYLRAVVIGNDDPTKVSFAIPPKKIIADVTKLVTDLWAEFSWTKNKKEVIATLTAAINGGNQSRIDAGIIDDEASALRIIAFNFAHLI